MSFFEKEREESYDITSMISIEIGNLYYHSLSVRQ